MTLAPVAVALDGPDLATITGWAAAAGPHVSTMKVGLETYLRDGDAAVHAARLERQPVSVSSLCIAAAVPATTALR